VSFSKHQRSECKRDSTQQSVYGFTLIEVLVALTLLGLIATMVAAGTRLGLDLSARGNANTDLLRTEHLERNLLRGQIRGALPFRYWTNENNLRIEHTAFEGRPDRVRFVSRYGLKDGPDSLPRWIDIRAAVDVNPQDKLILEEHRILSPDNLPETTPSARLEIQNCSEVRFQYLDRTGETPVWISNWDPLHRQIPLPSALRMECKTDRDAMRLIIPLDYADSARQGLLFQ
jgi:prepilin-type N-terminal cleavage/methylation domain-containing protein